MVTGSLESNNVVEGSEVILTSNSGLVRKREICISDLGDLKPEEYLEYAKKHPHLIGQYRNNSPKFADALESGDIAQVRSYLMLMHMGMHKKLYTEKQELARIDQDPTNEENQKKIAEMIRLKNIQSNYEKALEDTPEVFGRVVMLYVDTRVNNIPVKCFVDSGAQSTIMTLKCVESVNLQHLIDTRFKGLAKGVGSCKILGRIHIAQMELGGTFYPVSITVLEGGDVDFLLGLDMLKRHHAVLDMGNNSMKFAGGNSVSFLSENQMPLHARGNYQEAVADSSTPATSSSSSSGTTNAPFKDSEIETAEKEGAELCDNSNKLPPVPAAASPMETQLATSTVDRSKIEQLMQMGFGESESVAVLAQASGDVELAASLLLSR